ncbi:uncharacterized protein ColSpa_10915 [Colletotrichum spaethianum]|uniref:Uncharacterized protein n=1 Tax=Colletotrichum spaethianum TaxID=700344 RepID=A0AA37PEH9_9PEZI|nr:uncharacterized protein ColSpa_10915 [Colletotrichum spaethianum]GKT50734.1 hypothetical protein ColSpa_10915 [Colletotrichum spaethianum]
MARKSGNTAQAAGTNGSRDIRSFFGAGHAPKSATPAVSSSQASQESRSEISRSQSPDTAPELPATARNQTRSVKPLKQTATKESATQDLKLEHPRSTGSSCISDSPPTTSYIVKLEHFGVVTIRTPNHPCPPVIPPAFDISDTGPQETAIAVTHPREGRHPQDAAIRAEQRFLAEGTVLLATFVNQAVP